MNVIFIPGLLCTKEVWGELNTIRSNFNCIDADVGHFNSIEQYSDTIMADIKHDEPYAIIGISMGGYVAIDIACRQPPWLKKLILISTTAKPVAAETLPDRGEAMELARAGNMDEILKISDSLCFYNKLAEYIQLEKRMADDIGCEVFINQQEAIISRQSYVERLSKIESRTLIISSVDDKIINFNDSLELFSNINNSEITIFKRCGHLPTVEKGRETSGRIRDFLVEPTLN